MKVFAPSTPSRSTRKWLEDVLRMSLSDTPRVLPGRTHDARQQFAARGGHAMVVDSGGNRPRGGPHADRSVAACCRKCGTTQCWLASALCAPLCLKGSGAPKLVYSESKRCCIRLCPLSLISSGGSQSMSKENRHCISLPARDLQTRPKARCEPEDVE